MEQLEITGLLTVISNLGIGGIFAFLYFRNGKKHEAQVEEMTQRYQAENARQAARYTAELLRKEAETQDKVDRIRQLTEAQLESAKAQADLTRQVLRFGEDVHTLAGNSTVVMERFCDWMDILKESRGSLST